jgi:hypothetical protein
MPLIKTIDEVREVLRVSSINSNVAKPDFEAAEQKYLVPKIGKALYQVLLTGYNNNDLTPLLNDLLKKIQKMVAAFAYYDDLGIQHTIITDTGVRKINTESMPTVYRWEYDQVRLSLINKGYQAEEAVFEYLEDNKAEIPTWTSSQQYAVRNNLLIKTASEFHSLYRLKQPYRTFNALLPVMVMVEDMYLIPSLGEAFFEELKTDASPSADEKAVLSDLKKAMAHLTIQHSFEKMTVNVSEDGASIYDRYADRGNSEDAQPTAEMMDYVINALKRDGQRYLMKAKSYLNAKASDTVFQTFFNSDQYNPPVERVDRNKGKRSFRF